MSMSRVKKFRMRSLFLLAVTVLLAAVTTTYAARYMVTLPVSPTPQSSSARAINNSGSVTGFAAYGSYSTTRAFVYSNYTTPSVFLSGPGGTSYGFAINGVGQIAGRGANAIIWTNGVPQDLGVLPGTMYGSSALGINDNGVVIGNSGSFAGYRYPFIWKNGVMTRLGNVNDSANSINSSGQIAGSTYTYTGTYPVIWDSLGNMTALINVNGAASDINDVGQVVGYYDTPLRERAFLWQGGNIQTLAIPAGITPYQSYAISLNDAGTVVGSGGWYPDWRALLWEGETVSDLNTLIPAGSGWILTKAWDINASGQIVGEGTYNGKTQAFILTPTPETQAAANGAIGCDGWYTSPVTVTLTAIDRCGSAIREIHYTLDGGTEVIIGDVTATVAISGDGTHTLTYSAVDYAGHVEIPNTMTVKIDGAVPSSAASLSGLAGTNGWYKSPVTVQINGSDATSGVGSIKYRKNIGGTWSSTYTAGNPAYVSFGTYSSGGSNGRFSVGYNAVDRACNGEAEKFVDVNIDTIPPVTTYVPSIPPNANGWYNSDVTANFTATDNLSGVASISVNGMAVPGSTASTTVTAEGPNILNYFATDVAGVDEASRLVTVKIDKTLPAVTVSTSPATLAATNKSRLVPVVINGSAVDSLSGLASVVITITDEYGIYNMTVPSFGSTVNLDTYKNKSDSNGRLYTIQAIATDLAGNQQASVYSLWVK